MTRKIRMPRAGYHREDIYEGFGPKTIARAIQWIALNDETAESDPDVMAQVPSVCCIADLFDREPIDVARAIVEYRGHKLP